MAILSSSQIRERLKLDIRNPRSLVITPCLTEDDAFDVDSIDLRLGGYFLLPQIPPRPFTAFDAEATIAANLRVHIPWGKYLVVPAHQTVLGATLEFIKIPADVSGQILTKSTVARTFVVIETAPWIHPSYRGCLTLEIANVSNTPILLHPGVPIGQLILQSVEGITVARKDANLSGSYMGPVHPEPSRFKDLKSELGKIGITNVDLPSLRSHSEPPPR
jgi:dCTP deaminase